jgi:hypothetical protein
MDQMGGQPRRRSRKGTREAKKTSPGRGKWESREGEERGEAEREGRRRRGERQRWRKERRGEGETGYLKIS